MASRGARAASETPTPRDPSTPLRTSGLPGAATLGRVGGRVGLRTVRDLLLWLPRRYDDLRTIHDLGSLRFVEPDTVVTARARVVSVQAGRTARRRVNVVTARLADGAGSAEAQWYGRQFVERRLVPGSEYLFSGKLRQRGFGLLLDNPAFQAPDGDLLHVARIVPVYRLTAGLALRSLRAAIRAALDRYGPYAEYLPAALLAAERLPGIAEAIEQAHFPDDFDAARRGAPPARVRRAAGAPGRHGGAPPPACGRGRRAGRDRGRARGGGARGGACRPRRATGPAGRPDARPGAGDGGGPPRHGRRAPDAAPPPGGRRARARPRSRPLPSPSPRRPAYRARCSPPPTSSPASTRRRSATCSPRSASPSRC